MSLGDTIVSTVLGGPAAPVDSNAGANSVAEGAAVNTSVGVTAHSTSPTSSSITYSLVTDSSGGGFKIDPVTGVVTVADPSKIDFESAPGHAYTITTSASDGITTSSQSFTIAVTDVAPSTPVDSNAAANTVAEGAANGTAVGITASSTDVNGPAVTWSLTGDTSGGGFTINATTGVITVADATKIDYESAAGHAYTVVATASDGTLTSSQSITIAVGDVAPSTPSDSNAATNTVAEGAANGSTVGVTASSADINGPAVTYSLIGDTSGGGFKIDAATGVVTVADSTKIDYESAAGHAYTITAQASDGTLATTQTFTIAVTDVAPSTPTDGNGATNTVVEGAVNGSTVGVTASSTDVNGPAVTYSLVGDSSGGGFTINAATGVVTVADGSKINYETAAGHAYTVTAQASDGTLTSSQTFTIAVTDVAPSTPVDSNAATNLVMEGAANGTTVGVTAASTDINGPAVTYSLTGDSSGGGFTINAATGVVSVADSTKIDFESAAGHAYTVTATASDGTLSSSQNFTIAVADVPLPTPVDTNAAANSVVEGALANTLVGITASAVDPNGPATTYSLTGDTSTGGFKIDPVTGVVSVADPTKINFESSGGSYQIAVQANDGLQTTSQTFTIAVTDVAPSTPVDLNGAPNTVAEGANGTVGITASSTDVNGPAVTWSLTSDTSGGGFLIDPSTGVISVANSTKIDYETAAGHAYTVTAQASDGTLTSAQTFTIAVTDVAPSTPTDSNAAGNSIAEGAANGSTVGITASSTDINGPAVTYSLIGDTTNGGYTIDATTGVVTVADSTKIDYESAPLHSDIINVQASDGTLTSSQTFTIAVTNVAPSQPVDSDATANTVAEGAAINTTVGVTASSTDVNGGQVTYVLGIDSSGGGFKVDATTGAISVADPSKIDYESSGVGHSYTVSVIPTDGTNPGNAQTFTIGVTDVAPSTPVDSDGAVNQVSNGAPVGTHVGVTASSTDVNGPAVTYTLVGDTSGGGFTINSATGVVTVADPSKVVLAGNPTTYDVTADASDGTLHSQQTFTITVLANTPPVANDDSVSATEAGGLNNAVAGTNPSGNVILGTGAAGDVQDTDAQDPSSALTVVAVHTGPEGGSIASGTVGSPLAGAHGTLTLNIDGSYTYLVNQTDTQVQALATSAETITDVFNYTISDTGGLQDTATLTITIHGADDLPQAVADTGTMTEDDAPTSFNVIANDTQDPDHTATNAITVGPAAITVTGPAGETFVNTDATASIVSNQVQVSLTNSHFQQLALGEHATVTVPYTLTGDTGETSTANLVVTVNGVNDVPAAVDDSGSITEDQVGTFTVLGNDTLDADHGAPNNVTTGTVTNLVAPSGENIDLTDIGVSVNGSNQVVVTLGSDFQHMKQGETTTFDIPYTLHGDQAGDTSTATVHVTVTGVNDAPTANNVSFTGVNSANYNTDLIVNDPTDGAPTTTGPFKVITASLLSLSGASDVDGPNALTFVPGTITTTDGGKVVLQADGDFVFTPKVGDTNASDSFSFTVTDGNSPTAGTVTATATIALQGPHIWYVDASASAVGADGSSEHPFTSLAPLNGVGNNGATTGDVDSAGDIIFLANGTYTGGITLENNEQLISQSAGLVVADGGGGAGTVTLVAASGSNAVVQGGVVLGTGNNIQGIDFGATSGFALSGSSVGTVHVDDTTHGVINNASGGGVSIGGSSNVLNIDFTSVTTGAGTNGIALTNSSGTVHIHGGTLSNASGAEVSLNGGTVNFTDDGAINNTNGTNVSISSMTGGAQDFNGAITGHGISLTNNTGATMSFDGGTTLSTGTSNAFVATGGGTVTVTGTNHLTTTTGTALNISNTTIGASGVTFHDISSNGAANGIVLNTTGSSGGLTVTGTTGGTINATGGTITGSTGSGISLTSTSNVSLDHMTVSNSGDDGITGSSVTGFTLKDSTISGNGNAANTDHGLDFTNLLGTSSITNTNLTNNEVDQARIENSTGTATVTFDGVLFQSTGLASAPNGEHGLLFDTHSTGSADLNVKNSTFNNLFSNSIDIASDSNGVLETTINNNTFTNVGASGITIAQQSPDTGGGTVRFNIHDNGTLANPTFLRGTNTGASSSININQADNNTHTTTGVLEGQISNNFIGDGSSTTSASTGGSGIAVSSVAPGTTTVQIDHNTIQGEGADGIFATMGEDSNPAHTMNLTIFNNSATVSDVNSFDGIFIEGGVLTGDKGTLSLDMHDNTASSVSGNDFTLRQRFLTTDKLLNYGGANNDNAAVQTYLDVTKNNTAVEGSWFITNNVSGGGGGFVGTASVPGPTLPSPLLAAPGGVQASSPTPGETNLTQTELDTVVAAAIAQWAHAGASAAQLAMLSAITFSVADLAGNTIGDQTPGHIVIDVNADGHGWFVDPTPNDNSEFTHAQNAAGTDLLTDPTNAAAGHLDLLTTVAHEMGHELGLPDANAPADDLMYINLVDGERRLPDATDVAQVNAEVAQVTEAALPATAQPAGGAPIVVGTSGNDTIDAGLGGKILFGGGGADTFVFGPDIHLGSATAPAAQPITHVADYSAAQGDTFDFSALTSTLHASMASDASLVRAVEDPSGTFATLQLNTAPDTAPAPSWGALPQASAPNWVNVAQLDGAHSGDAVNVLLDSHLAVHLAQIHVGLLV
jgi:VCBS repeat-containing protein